MTPQSSDESHDSNKQDLESKLFKKSTDDDHHSKDEEVQSILKQQTESGKEVPSQSNSPATLHEIKESSVVKKRLAPNSNSQNVPSVTQQGGGAVEESGRERLKRHRGEVAGQVWIPEMWGQEELLKGWIDCSAFDASLMNSNIMLARAALVQQGRRPNSGRLTIENSC